MAKRGVALKACRLLHLKGELGDDLLPLGRSSELMTDKTIYPMWDYDDEPTKDHKPGTRKNRRVYLKHVSSNFISILANPKKE
jgi:endoribonuclease Dicer